MNLVRVTPENFAALWNEIKPLLENCCARSRGRFSADTSVQAMVECRWQFWVGIGEGSVQVFAATEMLRFPTGLLAGNIIMTTGKKRSEWKHLIDDLAIWFKDQGCEIQQTLARKGWARELPDFDMTHVLLERYI